MINIYCVSYVPMFLEKCILISTGMFEQVISETILPIVVELLSYIDISVFVCIRDIFYKKYLNQSSKLYIYPSVGVAPLVIRAWA